MNLSIQVQGSKALATLCILASFTACATQFTHNHFLPLIIAVALLPPIQWIRPKWFKWALMLPAAAFLILLVDAFFLRHRIAVHMTTWSAPFFSDRIEDCLVSPSGRTTVYVVGSHWNDSAYSVYVSHGHLFPSVGRIETEFPADAYPLDLIANWRGPFFVAGQSEQSLSVAYDERDGHFYTFWDYRDQLTKSDFAKKLRDIEQGGANKALVPSTGPSLRPYIR